MTENNLQRPHKDRHKSGGADAFTSSDLLEAIVKRLQTTSGGGTTLTVGALLDGEFLKRSGTDIVGGTPATGLPKGYRTGLIYRRASASTITVEVGKCRDLADAADITLAAEVTPSLATDGAAAGVATKTATATASINGTATITASQDVLPDIVRRQGTGSINTSGTSVTGTGTKFLSELKIGDLIGQDNRVVIGNRGYSRVTAIASDTACTISNALPGGDITMASEFYAIVEGATVRVAAQAGQRINTITGAGTSIVSESAWSGTSSGNALKFGVEAISTWYFVELRSGGSGTTVVFSTQRTTPYDLSGYTTSRRVLGAVRNKASGDLFEFSQRDLGGSRFTIWEEASADTQFVTNASASSWTRAAAANFIPPTSFLGYFLIEGNGPSVDTFLSLRQSGVGSSTGTRPNRVYCEQSQSQSSHSWCATDVSQAIDYAVLNGAAGHSVDVIGFVEVL